MNKIDQVLAERGKRYGDFTDHAVLAQQLQDVMRKAGVKVQGESWDKLSYVQKQALSVIADKIARILSGDPNYDDNWIDIQGYAKLAQDRLPNQGEAIKHGEVIPVRRGETVQDAMARAYRPPLTGQRQMSLPFPDRYGDLPFNDGAYTDRVAGFRNPVGYPEPEAESRDAQAGCICN